MFAYSAWGGQPPCPIPEERREWLEHAFGWLVGAFGEGAIRERRVLVPHYTDFPIQYDGSRQSALDTVAIIARQMEIDPGDIEMFFYGEGVDEVGTGAPFGQGIFMDRPAYASGRYLGKAEDGKYHIALEQRKLREPEYMVATLAHELAHIKLLGEERLEENDEQLTDLTTIVFGLGVFNANAAFVTYANFRSYGWRRLGYLKQMDWGYVLALFARLRGETDPAWVQHLCKNVKSDFTKSYRYLESLE